MGQELGKAHYKKDANSYLTQDEITDAWKTQMDINDVILGAAIEIETPRSRQRQRELGLNGNERGYARHYQSLKNEPRDIPWKTVIGLVDALKYIPERYSNNSNFFKYESDATGKVVSMVNVCFVGRERDNDHHLNNAFGYIPTAINSEEESLEVAGGALATLMKLPAKQPSSMYVKFWEFNLDRCSRDRLDSAISTFFEHYSGFFDLVVLNLHDTQTPYLDFNEAAFLREASRRHVTVLKRVANNKWHTQELKSTAYRKLHESYKANHLPDVDDERKTYVCIDRHGAVYDVHERLMLAEALKHIVQNRYPNAFKRIEQTGALEIFTRFNRVKELLHSHS